MPIKKHRVIIDTNLWISFLLTNNYRGLDKLIENGKIILLFSRELLEEFMEVANRPKFKKYFTAERLENLLKYIIIHSEFIEVSSEINICRDLKDNFLLSLAKDGNATHLITGDKDLLILKKSGKTQIVLLSDYLL